MKRIAILLIMVTSVLVVHAQQGLHINELFKGAIIPQNRMMETRVRGKMIAKYQLSYYHSLRFFASDEEEVQIKELMDKDHAAYRADTDGSDFSSIQSFESYSERNKTRKVKTYMIRLKPSKGKNRYLCYKSTDHAKDKKKKEMTVIYMEGALPSLDKLKSILQDTTK